MREIRSSGSAEGVMSNRDPYSDSSRWLWPTGGTDSAFAIRWSHKNFRPTIRRTKPREMDKSKERLRHAHNTPCKAPRKLCCWEECTYQSLPRINL